MSASSKKKIRKEQNAAMMTERQQKEQAEAKNIRTLTIVFSVIMILIVAIFVISQVGGGVNRSGIIEKNTIVATVGEHKLNSITMNYYFFDAVSNYCNNISNTYGDYADYFYSSVNLDLSSPLSEQVYDEETGETWADYFLSEAIDNAKADYALYDKAVAENFELPEDSQSQISTTMSYMQLYAAFSGVNDVKTYLRSMYGNGSSEKTYEEYLTVSTTASAYYTAHMESLEYDDAAIRAYEEDRYDDYSTYDFYSYYVDYEDYLTGGTTDEEGNTTYSDEEIAAARVAAEAAATTLATTNNASDFNAAILALKAMAEEETAEPEATEAEGEAEPEATEAEEAEPEATEAEGTEPEATEADATEPEATEPEASEDEEAETEATEPTTLYTVNTDVAHTDLDEEYAEWLSTEGLAEGTVNVFPYTTTSTDDDGNEVETVDGYYVLMFHSRNDRKELMDNVRHILFQFEGGTTDDDGNTTYSDEEKAAAKEEAEALLQQWKDGDATEESFIELVADNTDDSGSAETGGLYEDIHPDSDYVENFLNWAIDDARQVGDTEIVETEYGYHVMYYVGNSDLTYRDYLIKEDMTAEEMEEWYNSIVDAVTVVEGDSSRINKDLVYSAE